MNIADALYHARVQHMRNVIDALGHVRIEKGLSAFENGASNWSHCFFARAFEGELDLTRGKDPELQIMEATGLKTRVAIRFVWQSFDSLKARTGITRDSLRRLIRDIMAQNNTLAVDDLINSLEFDESKPCTVTCEV